MRNEALFRDKPVWSAILTLAVPAVLSILVMLLYNMADMFFVGLLHDNTQVAAVSVVGPVFSLVTAAATMIGVGGCATISKAAGAGEINYARTCASLCGWFCLLFGAVAALLLIIFAAPEQQFSAGFRQCSGSNTVIWAPSRRTVESGVCVPKGHFPIFPTNLKKISTT